MKADKIVKHVHPVKNKIAMTPAERMRKYRAKYTQRVAEATKKDVGADLDTLIILDLLTVEAKADKPNLRKLRQCLIELCNRYETEVDLSDRYYFDKEVDDDD